MPPDGASSGSVDSSTQMMVSNDQLAAQLMECAILVKKGERGPLLRKTIHDLTDYLTNANYGGGTAAAAATVPPPPPDTSPAGSSSVATNSPPRSSGPPSSLGNLSTASSNTQISKHQHKASPFIAGLGKIMGLTDDNHPAAASTKSTESRAATSAKNAQRIRMEVTSHSDWCEEHFTMGCACKTRRAVAAEQNPSQQSQQNQESAPPPPHATPAQAYPQPTKVPGVATAVASARPVGTAHPNQHHPGNVSASASYTSASNRERIKPAFQRPSNPKSSLIANGWIEQQRRSKMRIVWKDVLASLVEGRRPGEETTLWIQREVTHERTGHVELEALHQIPVKLVEQIQYQPSYAGEHQKFIIRAYNTAEEYIFRCRDEEAAQNWVLTLRSVQQLVQQRRVGAGPAKTGVDDWERERVTSSSSSAAAGVRPQPQHPQSHQPPHQTPSPPPPSAAAPPEVRRVVSEEEKKADHPPYAAAQAEPPHHHQQQPNQHRMTVTELRAIAHGAGYNTHGMERGELEQLVSQIAAAASGANRPQQHAGVPGDPSSPKPPQPTEDDEMLRRQQLQKQQQAEVEARRRKEAEEYRRRQETEEEAAAKRRAEAEKQKNQEEERARLLAERIRDQQAAERKRREEEEERRRLAEERQRRDEEELRRRAAEKQAAEERRKQEEAQKAQQQQWQQQQQAWQKQQAEEEQRRRAAEAQAAETRRQQEEAYRRQQQWHHQQQQYTAPPGSQSYQHPRPPQPQQGYQQRPPNASFPGAAAAHTPGVHAQSPPPPQGSAVNMKYAKMAQQSDDGAAIWNIKHGILVQWALLPPMMQVLRPIEDLLTTIHMVFPPQFGVPGHEYFTKFSAITHDEITLSNRLDDTKLKKAMRKLRFFLHPDKLPRDLSKEQSFMCKMLWDIISDAEAEHKKKEEELSWIRG